MHMLVAASCCHIQRFCFASSLTLSVGQQNKSGQLGHKLGTVKVQTSVGAEEKLYFDQR